MVVPPNDSIVDNTTMPSRMEASVQNGPLASRNGQNLSSADRVNSSHQNGEMSQLDQLLQQVNTLKQENSTLKSELSNNTSQISRLESEASSLKEMVVMLGNSIGSQQHVATEHGDMTYDGRLHSYRQSSRMSSLPFAPYTYQSHGFSSYSSSVFPDQLRICSGSSLDLLSPSYNQDLGVLGKTKEQIRGLQMRRSAILDSLRKEEITKECYMRQLRELSERLQILDADQAFSPADEESTRHQLEAGIREVKEAMEQDLGAHEAMNQRVHDWLLQIRQLEQEILKIHTYLSHVESPVKSPMDGLSPRKHTSVEDRGTCEQHAVSHRNNKQLVDVSVQTSRSPGALDVVPDEKLVASRNQSSDGRQNATTCCISTQTKLTCLVRKPQSARTQRAASVVSLPDHLGAGKVSEERAGLDVLIAHLSKCIELIQQHCQLLRHALAQHGQLAEIANSESARAALHSIGIKAQISDGLLRSVKEVRQLSQQTESHRGVINQLQGPNCLADLLIFDRRANRDTNLYSNSDSSDALAHDASSALANLCFGNNNNKTMLMKKAGFIETVVDQLRSSSEAIAQPMACVLRNLSWQADAEARELLRSKRAAFTLMECVTSVKREGTLKSMLGALWNLSLHGSENKVDICAHEGFLTFLVSVLPIRSSSQSELEIVSNGGGLLRNVSCVIAKNDEYRKILRQHNCLHWLVQHLTSSSLTVVSNACLTLWNLSARDPTDQHILWELGAVSKLRKLVHSKHKDIAQGSKLAIRNLLAARPQKHAPLFPSGAAENAKRDQPGLQIRKMKQFESEYKGSTRLGAPERPQVSTNDFHQGHALMNTAQRNSLQEGGAQNLTSREHDTSATAGIYYSGSLGNLSQRENAATAGRKPFQAWEANASSPIQFSAVREPFAGISSGRSAFVQGLDHPVYPTVPAERHPRPSTLLCSDPYPSSSLARLGVDAGHPSLETKAERTWGQQSDAPGRGSLSLGPVWKNMNSAAQALPVNSHCMSLTSPCRMPNDLEAKLRYADMQEDEERPVNYSLQFTDEHSRTPGVQSPRADMFQSSSPLAGNQMRKSSSLRKVVSSSDVMSGAPQMGLASGSNASAAIAKPRLMSRDAWPSASVPKVDRSVEELLSKADRELYETDDKPTDFGRLYTEMPSESVAVEPPFYQHLSRESFQQEPYVLSPTGHAQGGSAGVEPIDGGAERKCDGITSHYDAHHSLHNASDTAAPDKLGSNPEQRMNTSQHHMISYENDEDYDKFEVGSGAVTPGHYYSNRHGTRSSGYMTPKTSYYEETPLVYSPTSSTSSLGSVDMPTSPVERDSLPESRLDTGIISPSDLPDSPGQSMPPSRSRSPTAQHYGRSSQQPFDSIMQVERESNCQRESHTSVETVASRPTSFPAPVSRSAGYVPSLPVADEIKSYSEEPAMSEMTAFSGLTVDGDSKVAPLGPLSEVPSLREEIAEEPGQEASEPPSTDAGSADDLKKLGTRAMKDAGYITSLPTSDEIKHYVTDGTFSPMTNLSEISALRDHNDGFQLSPKSAEDRTHPTGSNQTSIATRSSATGASAPPPPVSVGEKSSTTPNSGASSSQDRKNLLDLSPRSHPTCKESLSSADELDSSDSLSDCTDGDEALLTECIMSVQMQSKPSRSSRSGKPSSSSSRAKEKAPPRKPAPAPANTPPKPTPKPAEPPPPPAKDQRRFDIKGVLAAADNKLHNMTIVQYIDQKISGDDHDALRGDSTSLVAGDDWDRTRNLNFRQVIQTAETLDESYSVKRHQRANERQTQAPLARPPGSESVPSGQAKVCDFLHNIPVRYHVENTPIEMSRATSLSNLTVDSGPDMCDVSALQRRIVDKQASDVIARDDVIATTSRSEPVAVRSTDDPDPETPDAQVKVSNDQQTARVKVGNDQQTARVKVSGNQQTVPGELDEPKEKQISDWGLGSKAPMSVLPETSATDESRKILDNLGRQIEDLTISTADRMVSCVGYITSLPHGDEIKPFKTEGSVGAFTNFSALTIDSSTKIKPSAPDLPQAQPAASAAKSAPPPPPSQRQPSLPYFDTSTVKKTPPAVAPPQDPCDMPDVQSRHYGLEIGDATSDDPRRFRIEDTPLNMSGNSSLSSIEIESSDEEVNKLLDLCISSAMPVARVDPTAPLPPNQLLLQQPMNPNNFASAGGRGPGVASHATWNASTGTGGKEQLLSAISPPTLVSLSSPEQPSTSFSISSTSKNRPGDAFYRRERQQSDSDSLSDTSLGAGADAHTLMKMQKNKTSGPKIVTRKSSGREQSDEVSAPVVRGGKKSYRNPTTGKPRENRRYASHCKEAACSSSSSSAQQRKDIDRRRTSSSSKSPCNKCHPNRSARAMPISASTSKLADGSSRPRHKGPGSTCSKHYRDPGHPMRKPVRSRSAHSACYSPYGTQLYPPIKSNDMLNGVACMAARGDVVVAEIMNPSAPNHPPQMVPVTIGDPYSVARPVFLKHKQKTFIKDSPSDELLRSEARNKPKKSSSAPTKLSKKATDQPIGKNILKGLKKLLSPSDEPKGSSMPQAKGKKGQQASKSGQSGPSKSGKGFDSGTWTKNKDKRKSKAPSAAKAPPVNPATKRSNLSLSGSSKTSSLSLSSSSDDSTGGHSNAFQASGPKKNIYPTERTIKPAQHVPKSPSLRSSMAVNRAPKRTESVASSWRRTPTPDRTRFATSRKISDSSSSSTGARHPAARTMCAGKRKSGSQSASSSVRGKPTAGSNPTAGQVPQARSLSEEVASSSKTNPAELSNFFPPPVRRVVQEVAPFNYRPNPKSSGTSRTGDDSSCKSDMSRRHTAV